MSLNSLNPSSAFPSSPVKARILSPTSSQLLVFILISSSTLLFCSSHTGFRGFCVAACCNCNAPLPDVYLACFFTFCLMFLLKSLFSVIASLDTTQNFNTSYFLSPFLLSFLTFALITNILYILIIYLVQCLLYRIYVPKGKDFCQLSSLLHLQYLEQWLARNRTSVAFFE